MARSPLFISLLNIFKAKGWQADVVDEKKEVIHSLFEAHHSKIHVYAQVFLPIQTLSIITEAPLTLDTAKHLSVLFELINRVNKMLVLGNFEYDLDRNQLVFKMSHISENSTQLSEKIVASMLHSSITELDRLIPCASTIQKSNLADLLSLSISSLIERQDWIPKSDKKTDKQKPANN